VGFGIIWAIMTLLLFFVAKKTPVFLAKESKLNIKEKKDVNLFLKSLIAFSIFSIIFTYSDMFILGRFVSSEYIGYYQVAMGLIGSLSTLVIFSGALFPIFSRMKGNALETGFKKALKITGIISFALFAVSFLSSNLIINILYGKAYAPAISFFRALCLLLILWPFTALYNGYFMAKGKPEVVRNLLVFTAIFNLVLTFFIAYFLSQHSNSLAVLGLIFGTVFSNLLYLMGCIWKKRS
jgi:O-antigen/teichoic acid export membrane protein